MRILVVEDHDSVARFIAKGLREELYAVDRASTGTEGLQAASVNDYGVIILDVMLPGKNGLEVAAELRRRNIATPILMLTVRDRVEDRVKGLDAGADDYLVKPFAFAELLARVRALLRRRERRTEPILSLADLSLDPVSHKVARAGQIVDLTNREYALLDFMIRNKRRVLTRTAIIEHVWDMNFDSNTNLVDVHIRHLRSKLDEGFSPKLIHTVRGVGYVLRDE